jgi:hypothetical protein
MINVQVREICANEQASDYTLAISPPSDAPVDQTYWISAVATTIGFSEFTIDTDWTSICTSSDTVLSLEVRRLSDNQVIVDPTFIIFDSTQKTITIESVDASDLGEFTVTVTATITRTASGTNDPETKADFSFDL